MTTLTYKAESLTIKKKPRVNDYQRGTEYSVTTADGINTILPEYSVTFKDTKTNIESIDTLLSDCNATATFLWNPLNGLDNESVAVPCLREEWDTTYNTVGYSTLSATFKQQPI